MKRPAHLIRRTASRIPAGASLKLEQSDSAMKLYGRPYRDVRISSRNIHINPITYEIPREVLGELASHCLGQSVNRQGD